MSVNVVILQGNLTTDPELRYIPSGNAVCDLRMASNTKSGDKEETVFINVTVWGKQAEVCNTYLKKGREITVEGRLKFDQWEADGAKRSKHTITASNVHFGSLKSGAGVDATTTTATNQNTPDVAEMDEVPF